MDKALVESLDEIMSRAEICKNLSIEKGIKEPTYTCRCGHMRGWLACPDGTLRPCEVCNPVLHERWRNGRIGERVADVEASRKAKSKPWGERDRSDF